MAKFFMFSQNNSGGNFVVNKEKGVAHYVIIEAKDAEAANKKALALGLYFNGVAEGKDCGCCGDRWCETNDSESADYPHIYGVDVSNGIYETTFLPFAEKAFIHYLDNRIVEVTMMEEWTPS